MDAEEAGAGAGAGPSETGRRSVGGVMSKTSKADYAVYTLGRPGQTKVVAIIDAKKHITPHSVAQVIGYYSAFEVGDPRPLVVVLTAYELKIVIFPFHDGSQRLVNAVELQEFKLWKGEEGRMLDVGVLNLLLSLMHDESFLRNYSVEAKKANIPQEARIPKNRVCTIVTDQAKFEEISKNLSALNRMVRQLKEDRVKWLREQKQQQRELKKMRKLKKQKDLEMRKLKKQNLEMRKLKKQNLEMRKLEKELKELKDQNESKRRKRRKRGGGDTI